MTHKTPVKYSEYYIEKDNILSSAPFLLLIAIGAAIDTASTLINRNNIKNKKKKIKTSKGTKFELYTRDSTFSFICAKNDGVILYYQFLKRIFKKDKIEIENASCYIATVCYGDYKTPQVQAFLHFRNEYLLKSIWGRLLVRFYYLFSPFLAKWLMKKTTINKFVRRKILDKIYFRMQKGEV